MNVRAATLAAAFLVLLIALVSSEGMFDKCDTICPPDGDVKVKGCVYRCPSGDGFGKYKDNVRCMTTGNAGSPTEGVCDNGICMTINGDLDDYPFPEECAA